MSEHRDSGAAAPAVQQSLEQQSLEQQPLPAAHGLPGAQWHWGPGDGAGCRVRAHSHTVTSNNLLVTREQSSRWRKDGAGWDRSRAELPGMEWDGECLNRERTKEGGCEKEKEANPSSSCWRERERDTVTVRHSTTNY